MFHMLIILQNTGEQESKKNSSAKAKLASLINFSGYFQHIKIEKKKLKTAAILVSTRSHQQKEPAVEDTDL